MLDFPQRLWSPKAALQGFKNRSPERALLMVRGDTAYPELDERVVFWRRAVSECLGLSGSSVQLTTFPAIFNFLEGSLHLRAGSSILMMEAPSTIMPHTPGVLFNDIHTLLKSEGTLPREWERIFPFLLSTQGESYTYVESVNGKRPIRDGEERLELAANFNRVARLSVQASDYQEKVCEALIAIRSGISPAGMSLPD
jgi:hypothetical protein